MLLAVLALLLSPFAVASPAFGAKPDDDEPKKVFVCKYVGTPGVDERLQGGNNPISVSVNAIIPQYDGDAEALIGMEFADQHGASIVIAVDEGQEPEPGVSDCAAARGPGVIQVDKVVTGTDASGTEPFAMSVTGETGFTLSGNADPVWFEIEVDPQRSYAVSEALGSAQATAGWTLTGIVCTSDATGAVGATGFTVGYSETVSCVVTNDFSAPVVEPDTATINVDKEVTGADADADEGFAISVTGRADFVLSANDEPDSFLIELDGSTYSVGETLTQEQQDAGWTLTSIVCTSDEYGEVEETEFTLDPDETVSCVITNAFQAPLRTGSITIVKDAVPDTDRDFAYTVTGNGLSIFWLDDDADATLPNSQTFSGLVPGLYTVTEVPAGGWTASVTCLPSGSPGGWPDANNNRQANIQLVAGAHVTCTFVNTQDAVVPPAPALVIDTVATETP